MQSLAAAQLATGAPAPRGGAGGSARGSGNNTTSGGGLLDDMLKPKPAFTMMQDFFALFGAYGRHLPALAVVAILLAGGGGAIPGLTDRLSEWLALDPVLCVGGTWLLKPEDTELSAIEDRARVAAAQRGARSGCGAD